MTSPRLSMALDGPEDGARAMARDETLLAVLRDGEGPASATHLFRAHGWLNPTITLGRSQPVPEALVADARAHGVEVVRRPTGGGWLLHLPGDLALTLAVLGPLGQGDLRRAARLTSQAIAIGMAGCGRPALVFTGSVMPASRADVCFMRADRDEVTVGTTKIAGVALARFGRSALVQAAIPLVAHPRELSGFAERWDPCRAPAAEVCDGLDRRVLWRAACDALVRLLEADARAWHWPAAALRAAEQLRGSKYQDDRYTRRAGASRSVSTGA